MDGKLKREIVAREKRMKKKDRIVYCSTCGRRIPDQCLCHLVPWDERKRKFVQSKFDKHFEQKGGD